MMAQSRLYGLDHESAYYIRDVEFEAMNKHAIGRHMKKLFYGSDRVNWNRTIPKHCNIQIANVSYQLKLQAETCGHYAHCQLKL